MKNKAKTLTPSTTIIIDSNNSSSIGSKNISFVDNKKEYKYANRLNKKQKNRQINSLDELTKKFSKCVYRANTTTINLNSVMKKIKAKKRRIYDITNVMEGETIFILIFILIIIIGIGLIQKDSKNQIRLEPDFYKLYKNNENNKLIELDEENEKDNDIKNEIKSSQCNELKNEINYLRQLIKETDEKLSKEIQNNNIINIENLDEILDLKNKNNFENQSNNFKTKDIPGKNDAKKAESATRKKFELEENGNYQTNSNKLCLDSNKKEDFFRIKKEEENLEFNGEFDLFIPENIKNDINIEILKNSGMDFDLRKDSFISDLSNIENSNYLIDSEQFFE